MDSFGRSTYHILLIEDNAGDEILFKEVLTRSRYNTICTAVSNGEDALAFLYRRGAFYSAPLPDLVLMDLTLPRLDGFELLRVIKGDPQLRSIPVVIFTGSDRPEDIQKAYTGGANGYVTKPIGIKQLEEKVRALEEFWFNTAKIPSRV
jgi:two-component system, chemotaxis family, response regulator Rcp1